MRYQLLTANDLRTGQVVFLSTGADWSADLQSVHIIDDDVMAQRLLERAAWDEKNNQIVNPSLIEVTLNDGYPVPVRLREQLRIFGPSTHHKFRKVTFSGGFIP